jgi:hypothetical protein
MSHTPKLKLESPKYWYCEKCNHRLDYQDGEWIAQSKKHNEKEM